MSQDPEFVSIGLQFIEFLGTYAFAISGIRHAAAKNFDWFGGLVCAMAVAVGGGTLRDLMLGVTPFWMTSPLYLVWTVMAQVTVVVFNSYMKRLNNAWFVFDTLGLALFTIAGMEKTLVFGHPYWVAIIMGTMTGSAGGVLRDVLLNNVPVIFHKEIYAMASILGGCVYCLLHAFQVPVGLNAPITFAVICLIRFLAVKYHLSLPVMTYDEGENPTDK